MVKEERDAVYRKLFILYTHTHTITVLWGVKYKVSGNDLSKSDLRMLI